MAKPASPGSKGRKPERRKARKQREPSILIVGELGRDSHVIADQLKTLHYDPGSYHGKLQVILSALRRMEPKVIALIEEVER